MKFKPNPKKYVILSLAIIIFSIGFNIINNKIRTRSLKPNEAFTVTIDENLPRGDYFLEYYIACSSTSNAAMSFTLVAIDSSGNEIIYENRQYKSAIGFGISGFKINDSSDIVKAEFKLIGGEGLTDRLSVSAGIGTINLMSSDGSYQKTVFAPGGIGKQAVLNEHADTPSRDIRLSDFATLQEYSLNGKMLELKYLCTKEITEEYELGVKITSDNINALLPDGARYSFYAFNPATDSWIAGEEYTQSINLGLIPGQYQLEFALSPVSPKTPRYISNYLLMDNKEKIPIGDINIPGQSLADYLRDVSSDGQLLIMSIMDEGAMSLNEMSLYALSELGLKQSLKGKTRWSYTAVAAKGIEGFTPFEKLEQELIEVNLPKGSELGSFSLPFDLRIVSAGFTVGNTSSIIINGTEYSQRRRGINIVVFDLNKNEVVDSVSFDTYQTNYN